jgi:hypothetical protein
MCGILLTHPLVHKQQVALYGQQNKAQKTTKTCLQVRRNKHYFAKQSKQAYTSLLAHFSAVRSSLHTLATTNH